MRLHELEKDMEKGAYVTRGDSRVFRLSRPGDPFYTQRQPLLMGVHIGDGYSGEAIMQSMLDWADFKADDWCVFDGRTIPES